MIPNPLVYELRRMLSLVDATKEVTREPFFSVSVGGGSLTISWKSRISFWDIQ